MATFDDKSIFSKREVKEEPKPKKEKTEELEDEEILNDEVQSENEEHVDTLDSVESGESVKEAKVIGEELIESESVRKAREKREKKEKRIAEKQHAKMVKKHRKALKKNPENIKRYDTDITQGLPDEVVEKRVLDNLVNATKKGSTKSRKKIVFSNIFTFFNILTLSIAIWLMTVQAWTDLVFLVIVTANTVIGIYQELKAKNTIDKLSLLSAPSAVVIRNGSKQEINVSDVVLDDLLVLESGNQICADSIVVSGSVEVNESLLTGESNAVIKKAGDLLFSGSFVVSGNCRARVDKVGKDNYIEKLSDQAKLYRKPNSDLLKSLKWIIRGMTPMIIVTGITLFLLQYFNPNIAYVTAVRKTAGAIIGMIPSGLWLLTSIALFVGVIKLSQKNVLVQELYCIEMLARINVLCLDKTGTITDGTMSVKNVIDYNSFFGLTTNNIVSAMLNALNESNLTAVALQKEFGLNKRIKYTETIPFSSQRKFNAVTFDKMGTFALGAPEYVLKSQFVQVQKEVQKNAGLGYRVLCLAHFNGSIQDNKLPNTTAEVVSLILIEDNIRPDAIKTINYFKESGVSVRVISGDDPLTVSKISERAGIENANEYISLEGLSDAEVERAALKYTVFGRVSPSQKKLLVTTLKNEGKKVAMTGDGVNDILALREADCSIAIASGSEAARNVSHLVLLDSNFDSMPKVVSEGRRVINNVTNVASLFLTKTIFSLLLAIQAMINGGAYPISTNQLIMIDLFAIGIPSFFLALEANNKEVDGNFLANILKGALPGALTIMIISLLIFGLSGNLDLDTISIQTIIGIAATHTCLMVLFKVCKPFNTLRRTLCTCCYGAFLIIAFLLPQFLEFRPLVGFSQYYNSSIKEDVYTSFPGISRSSVNTYVFNGKYLNGFIKNANEPNISIACVQKGGKFYYTLNGIIAYKEDDETKEVLYSEEVVIPEISFLANGNIVLGGKRIFYQQQNPNLNTIENVDIIYEQGIESKFDLDENGYLLFNGNYVMRTLTETDSYYNFSNKYGANRKLDVKVCLMPTIEIVNDQLTVIARNSSRNSTDADTNRTYRTSLTSRDKIELKIDKITKELLVNGKKLAPILTDGTQSTNTYKVEMPTISFDKEGYVTINGIDTTIPVSNFNVQDIFEDYQDVSINVVPYDASYYIVDNLTTSIPTNGYNTYVRLSNPSICPDISTAEAGNCVIDGYYTSFKYNTSAFKTAPTLKVDSDYNLVIGGVTTDYRVSQDSISTTTGGIVKELTIHAKIFLLMLCLLSIPLMRLLQAIVPWIKRQVAFVQKILSKF
ncbi:MAG: HAD-IC family P-type ATPase [Anaeroplasmataceae bacterium]|nr:HAD-IC family P-type ATPase [Anaeroplasmataceae bacterium]